MLALALLVGPTAAAANPDAFPARPIDFICPWGPGPTDTMARQLGSLGQLILGVAVPVSNTPGASGNTGIAQLLNSTPDGYTIAAYVQDTLMTLATGQAAHRVGDLDWIARTEVADAFLFVRATSRFKTVHDLFRQAQVPGKVRVATAGAGSVDELSVRFLDRKGHRMTSAPYPKPSERVAAVLRGLVDALYERPAEVLPLLRTGELRPVLVFADRRHPAFPDVPSTKELGLDLALPQFRGVVARRGTPPERVQVLADAFRRAMAAPQWQAFARASHAAPDSYLGPGGFEAWVVSELETLDRLVRELGLRK